MLHLKENMPEPKDPPPNYVATFEDTYGSLSGIDWGPTCRGCGQRESCCRGLDECEAAEREAAIDDE